MRKRKGKPRPATFCSANEPPAEEQAEVQERIRRMRDDPIGELGPELGARRLEKLRRLQEEREGQFTIPNVSIHREYDERAPNHASSKDESYLNYD